VHDLGCVAELGQDVVLSDSSSRQVAHLLSKQQGFHYPTSVPLRFKIGTVGTLILLERGPQKLSRQRLQLLAFIGQQIGFGVHSAHLSQRVRDIAVAQSLCSMILTTQTTCATLERDSGKIEEQLAHLQEMAQASLAEVRSLVSELHPPSTATERLEKQASNPIDRTDLELDLRLEGQGWLRGEQMEEVLRIV